VDAANTDLSQVPLVGACALVEVLHAIQVAFGTHENLLVMQDAPLTTSRYWNGKGQATAAAAGLARLVCIIASLQANRRSRERRNRCPLEVVLGSIVHAWEIIVPIQLISIS
jgi:hypothetical protein